MAGEDFDPRNRLSNHGKKNATRQDTFAVVTCIGAVYLIATVLDALIR